MVAEKLDKKLRESLRDMRSGLFTSDLTQSFGLVQCHYALCFPVLKNQLCVKLTNFGIRFQRPLLVLLDRNMDMATPLHHTWTYQALVHDVLDFNLNRVIVQETEGDHHHQDGHRHTPAHRPKIKTYELNPTDKFWVSHRGSPFPTVAESIQEELEEYKASEGEVKRLKESMVRHRLFLPFDLANRPILSSGTGPRKRSRYEYDIISYS